MSDNPWIVQEPRQVEQVPNGAYLGLFKGIEEYTLPSGEVKWRFGWLVKKGEHAGKEASALTERGINPNTLAGRLIAGLLCRAIKPGENVKEAVDACKGKEYLVVVSPGPKGGKPGVKSVSQPPEL